jgi:hypothetical protein
VPGAAVTVLLAAHGAVALLLLGLGSLCRWPLKAVAIVATAALFAGSYVVGWGAILGWPTSMFPQPGLARDLAARGALVPLGGDMRAWFEETSPRARTRPTSPPSPGRTARRRSTA